jgi:hypothetical protein
MPVVGVSKSSDSFARKVSTSTRNDLKQYSEFIGRTLRDLLEAGEAAARANLRDIYNTCRQSSISRER